MKYYLKLEGDQYTEGVEFSNVSEMKITGVYRKENVQQNVVGDYLVDRIGKEKLTIKAKLNMLSTTEMYSLRQARERIENEFTFDRGGVRTTKKFRINQFEEPTPIYYNPIPNLEGGYNYSVIYPTLTITLEEM